MLVSLFDAITGFFTRRWLIGRRIVLDFSGSKEQRVAVINMPQGSCSFDLRPKDGGGYALEMSSVETGQVTLATYDDLASAEKMLKKLKIGILRPFTKIVFGFLGIFIIMVTTDLMSVQRSNRLPQKVGATTGLPQSSALTQEQVNQLRERMVVPGANTGSTPKSSPGGSSSQALDSSVKDNSSSGESSAEAQAAIKLLKGK